jgi:hypothetical protein
MVKKGKSKAGSIKIVSSLDFGKAGVEMNWS